MDGSSIASIVAALGLVALNGFFVASEFAFVKARRTRLKELADQGDKRAIRSVHIVDNLNAYLTANQLGITLASLGLGWLGKPAVFALLAPIFALLEVDPSGAVAHGVSVVIAFTVVTLLHTVLGELVLKSLAILRSEEMSLLCAHTLHGFYVLAYPIIFTFNTMANWVVKGMGYDPHEVDEHAHSVEELRMVVLGARRGGDFVRDRKTDDQPSRLPEPDGQRVDDPEKRGPLHSSQRPGRRIHRADVFG